MKSIGIIGYGFVGKATAELKKVCKINIYDPYLSEFSSFENKKAAYESDFVIACVPTPEGLFGAVDLSVLDQVLDDFKLKFNSKGVFVIKSTIPAGTIDFYCNKYNTRKIIHFPEFLTERTNVEDFNSPSDVILGGDKSSCESFAKVLKKFYKGKKVSIQICSAKEAELVKTIRNSFYATKVAFMNQIYLLTKKLDVDYDSLEKLITNNGEHPWWGPQHTKVPGPDGKLGFGGKCFPKDSAGLYQLAESLGVKLSILKAAIDSNKEIRDFDVE